MSTDILIVSHEWDFCYLRHCLRSIAKFATEFNKVVLVIPNETEFSALHAVIRGINIPLEIIGKDQWPENGMLFHEWMIMDADELCPSADFILHMDSDCIFTEPVTPEDYFNDGKPILLYAPYEWCVMQFQNENFRHWKTATERAIGGRNDYEFMRRHPAVHYRETYRTARQCINAHTGMEAPDYIRKQRGEYPQGFCEFVTLGEIAWRHYHERYCWIDQTRYRYPKNKMFQMWSHGPLDQPQKDVHGNRTFVPIQLINSLLGPE